MVYTFRGHNMMSKIIMHDDISFVMKDPEDCKKWLQVALKKFDAEDMNYIATMAFTMQQMETFIFSDEKRSADFFEEMKLVGYSSELH